MALVVFAGRATATVRAGAFDATGAALFRFVAAFFFVAFRFGAVVFDAAFFARAFFWAAAFRGVARSFAVFPALLLAGFFSAFLALLFALFFAAFFAVDPLRFFTLAVPRSSWIAPSVRLRCALHVGTIRARAMPHPGMRIRLRTTLPRNPLSARQPAD